MVIGANTGGGQAFRTIMQRPAVVGTSGYVSVFVELFAWMGTLFSHTHYDNSLYQFPYNVYFFVGSFSFVN